MRKVWIINLKDNRGKGENKHADVKFNLCYANGIIGIGWVNETNKTGTNQDLGYKKALMCLNQMSCGDLVWTRNPINKKYYICEIVSEITSLQNLKSHFEKNDISNIESCREVIYHEVGSKDVLPAGISYRNLISRSTCRQVKSNINVIEATNNLFIDLKKDRLK